MSALDKNQRLGVNLSLDHFHKGGKAFLLADGAGTGKTRQMLVTAHEWGASSEKPSLIITENKQVIGGSFTKDAKALSIAFNTPKSNVVIGTYDDLRTGKIGRDRYGLVIYDEAHRLKNPQSARSEAAGEVVCDHEMFATATPMDRPTAASYFLAKVTGFPESKIQRELGFSVQEVRDEKGELRRQAVLRKGMDWNKVQEKIVDLRDVAIASGAMLRREYPFYGEIGQKKIELSPEQVAEQQKVNAYFDAMADKAREADKSHLIKNIEGQRILALSRWVEPLKFDAIYRDLKKDLKAGRSVIVVAEGVQDTQIGGLPGDKRPALIGLLADRLEKEGVDFARIYGQGDKREQIDRFQNGEVSVALMTPQSGGTGVDLDDSDGDRPRTMLVATANFSGDQFEQILGRVSRRNTASPARVKFLHAPASDSDRRRMEILGKKIRAMRAIQHGSDVDASRPLEDIVTPQGPDKKKKPPAKKAKGLKLVPFTDRVTLIVGGDKADQNAIKETYKVLGLFAKQIKHGSVKGWAVPNRHLERFQKVMARMKGLHKARRFRLSIPLLLRRSAGKAP